VLRQHNTLMAAPGTINQLGEMTVGLRTGHVSVIPARYSRTPAFSGTARRPVRDQLKRVLGGGGGMGASGRGAPDQDARLWLGELPSPGLLAPVMVATQRREPTFAGDPALVPGEGMVQVAARRGAAAAGRGAPGATGADQVLELAAGLVSGFGLPVVTAAPGDRGQLDPQRAQVVLGLGVGRGPLIRAAAGAAAAAEAGCARWAGGWWLGGSGLGGSGPGGGGWRPAAQPWAAVPSGCRTVTHHRVCGLRPAAAIRSRAVPASSSPNPPASPGVPDRPSAVASGTVMFTSAAR
jgi:hypothetical protein